MNKDLEERGSKARMGTFKQHGRMGKIEASVRGGWVL